MPYLARVAERFGMNDRWAYRRSYSDQAWCYYVEWELTPRKEYGFFPAEMQDRYDLEILRLKLWRMGRVIIDSG